MRKRIPLLFFAVLIAGHSYAQVQTDCSTIGTNNNGQISTTTNCTSTDTGAAARAAAERQQENDAAMRATGNALGAGLAGVIEGHRFNKTLKKYCADHQGEPWQTNDSANKGTCPGEMSQTTAKNFVVKYFNAGFKKNGVAGYAEIVGDHLTVHSERASAMRLQMILHDPSFETELRRIKQAGVATYTYTNDANVNLDYDVKSGQVVTPPSTGAATANK